jgi:hypothetical protein
VIVYRWRSGFQHTLADVKRAHPDGVDGRTAVWMWRRILELLAWLHASDVAHGAVLPEHVLVHPRDHGAVLVGWSRAAVGDAKLHPNDVAMSARAVFQIADGASLPRGVRDLLVRTGEAPGKTGGARELASTVLAAATAAYGPPAFHPFNMPGWNAVASAALTRQTGDSHGIRKL